MPTIYQRKAICFFLGLYIGFMLIPIVNPMCEAISPMFPALENVFRVPAPKLINKWVPQAVLGVMLFRTFRSLHRGPELDNQQKFKQENNSNTCVKFCLASQACYTWGPCANFEKHRKHRVTIIRYLVYQSKRVFQPALLHYLPLNIN